MKGVGAVRDDDAPTAVRKGLSAGFCNDVPVLRANVIAEHVAYFDGVESSDVGKFWDGVKHFLRLKFGIDGPRGVIHL